MQMRLNQIIAHHKNSDATLSINRIDDIEASEFNDINSQIRNSDEKDRVPHYVN